MSGLNLRVGIIEDCKEDYDRLTSLLSKYQEDNKDISFYVTGFKDIPSFKEKYNSQFDLLFIDIDLNDEMNGLDLAKKIRENDDNVLIIFVTIISKFACNGYEVDALNYIIKPIRYQALVACLQKVIKIIRNQTHRCLVITSSKGVKKIPIDQIMYIEVVEHTIKVHSLNEVYEFNGTLKAIEKLIDSSNFFRCNYCYLVNFKYIDGIDDYNVLINGDKLSISHPRRKKFMKEFMDYLMKNNLMNK